MRARFFSKIRWQYFFSFLLVMIVVMTILLSFTFHSFESFLNKQKLDHYANSLRLFASATEGAITDSLFVAEQLSVTAKVTPFRFKEHPEKALQTSDTLRVYCSTYDAVSDLFLQFKDDDKVYSASGSYMADRFYREGLVLSSVGAGELKALMSDADVMTVLPEQDALGFAFNTTHTVRSVLPVVIPYTYATGLRCGTLLVLIERASFSEWLRQFQLENVTLLVSADNVPVLSFTEDEGDTSLLRASISAASAGDKVTLGGQSCFLLTEEVPAFGLSFSLLVPADKQYVLMSGSMSMLIMITLIAAAVGLTLITALVQSRVKPIMLLHEMLTDSNDSNADKPSVNELTQIRDGIQRLLSENQSMSEKIENMDVLQKSDFARRFITGTFSGTDEYLSLAEECRLNVDTRCFIIGLVVKPSDSTYELTAEKMNQFYTEQVGGVSRVLDASGRLAFVAFADDGDTLLAFLEKRFNSMKLLCEGVTMSVSAVHSDYAEGPRAFLEADMAFEMRFLRGNTQIIRFAPHAQPGAGVSERYQQSVERLRSALRTGDAEQVSDALRGISSTMHSMDLTLLDFRCMYNDILNVISTEARRGGMQSDAMRDLFRLSQCLSLDDLDRLLRGACTQVLASRVQRAESDVPDAVSQAHDMIASRFSEPDLSMSVIAGAVGFTDSKLSVEFKKAYHMTPLEFLTRKRMLQAKNLLLSSDMPIKDIAIECGYYDISAFNRRFKAYSGMTPQQYRLSAGASEEDVSHE